MPFRPLIVALSLLGLVSASAGAQTTAEDQARRWFESARTYLDRGNYREALEDLRRVVDQHPNTSVADDAMLAMATYHLDVNRDLPMAKTILEQLQKAYPLSDGSHGAQVLEGRMRLAASREPSEIDAATETFRRVPRVYPGSPYIPSALYYAGESLRLGRRFDEALTEYRRVTVRYPSSPWAARALVGSARCLALKGEPLKAIEELQRVRHRFPDLSEAQIARDWISILFRLYVLSPTSFRYAGKDVAGAGGKLRDVRALTIGADGALAVATKSAVLRFDTSGKPLGSATAVEPISLRTDNRGVLTAVFRTGVAASGEPPRTIAVPREDEKEPPRPLEEIDDMVYTALGDVLVADRKSRAILRFSGNLEVKGEFAAASVSRLAIDEFDRVAVLERDNKTIRLLTADGKPDRSIGGQSGGVRFDNVVDLAFDPLGHLIVLDRGRSTVDVFSPALKPVASFTLPDRAPGAFRRAEAFAVDQAGRLYIYDERAQRVQVYQ